MRLVDHKGADTGVDAQALQRSLEKFAEQQTLGRQINELVFAAHGRRQAPLDLIGSQRRVDVGGGDAVVLEQPHLVLHQRNQGRDDNTESGLEDSR